MPRDLNEEREYARATAEDPESVAVKLLDGVYKPSPDVAELVREYNDLRKFVDDPDTVAWPRSVDERMNHIYDSLIVRVS